MDYKSEKTIIELLFKIKELTENNLELDFSEHELYKLGLKEIIDNILVDYLKETITNNNKLNKFVKLASNKVKKIQREKDKKYKDEMRKRAKLWQLTQGKIPCLKQCGYTHNYATKNELLNDVSINFLCQECYKKDKDFSFSSHKNVFQLFHIV